VDGSSEAVQALKDFHTVKDDRDEGQKGLGSDPKFWDPVVPLFQDAYWGRAWYDNCFQILHGLQTLMLYFYVQDTARSTQRQPTLPSLHGHNYPWHVDRSFSGGDEFAISNGFNK
jgi:hypothetical protein